MSASATPGPTITEHEAGQGRQPGRDRPVDLRRPAQLIRRATEEHGRLDVLVNNVGAATIDYGAAKAALVNLNQDAVPGVRPARHPGQRGLAGPGRHRPVAR